MLVHTLIQQEEEDSQYQQRPADGPTAWCLGLSTRGTSSGGATSTIITQEVWVQEGCPLQPHTPRVTGGGHTGGGFTIGITTLSGAGPGGGGGMGAAASGGLVD